MTNIYREKALKIVSLGDGFCIPSRELLKIKDINERKAIWIEILKIGIEQDTDQS